MLLAKETEPIGQGPARRRPDAPPIEIWPLPPGQACFDAWQQAIALLVDSSVPAGTDPADFDFHGCVWQLPTAFVQRNGGSAMSMSRLQPVIDARPIRQMSLYLVVEGTVTTIYDGQAQHHRPGDIAVLDYSRPYESHALRYEGLTLTFDKAMAPAGLQGNVHGMTLLADTGAGALLGAQMRALVDSIDDLSVDMAQAAVDGMLRFAGACLTGMVAPEKRDAASVFQSASALARQNLRDPDFGPDALAAALNISRSKLFRAFEPQGGVQRWLLVERLRASLQSLVASAATPIAGIAHEHGFRSEAHFSRAFQKRYQTSPSSVRDLATGTRGSALYLDWMKQNAGQGGYTIEAWLAYARD